MKRALALLVLSGCASSFEGDLEEIRADIVVLEKKRILNEPALWSKAFDEHFEDGTRQLPDFIYFHVLRKLKESPAGELKRQAGEEFDWGRCMELPAAYRGRLWRVSGVIGRIWVEKIEDPDSPVKQVYAGIFYIDGRNPIFFHLVEKPDLLRLKEDVVEIDGLFLKVLGYRTSGGSDIAAPFFVAKGMRKYL